MRKKWKFQWFPVGGERYICLVTWSLHYLIHTLNYLAKPEVATNKKQWGLERVNALWKRGSTKHDANLSRNWGVAKRRWLIGGEEAACRLRPNNQKQLCKAAVSARRQLARFSGFVQCLFICKPLYLCCYLLRAGWSRLWSREQPSCLLVLWAPPRTSAGDHHVQCSGTDILQSQNGLSPRDISWLERSIFLSVLDYLLGLFQLQQKNSINSCTSLSHTHVLFQWINKVTSWHQKHSWTSVAQVNNTKFYFPLGGLPQSQIALPWESQTWTLLKLNQKALTHNGVC